MSIKDIGQKIKPQDYLVVLIIILVGLAGFGLGRLSVIEKSREEVTISRTAAVVSPVLSSATESKGLLVASKTGKKYHFPTCAGAAQISEKNKIWFASYAEAQKAGYTPAANCPGLE
ncbi:MAG: hypothetical protein WC027_03000 [Candidatus Paceibacterota bacterium]